MEEGWKQRLVSPAHAALESVISRLPVERFPDCGDLNALAGASQCGGGGVPLRFVRAVQNSVSDEPYEARVFGSGEIATRADNWHDLFNACAWLAFPKTKRELNRLHRRHAGNESAVVGRRSRARDALTLFDESGVLAACADASLAGLLSEFQWKAMFWTRRADVIRNLRFFVLGHALHEQLLQPYPGITGRALLLPVSQDFMHLPLADQLRAIDDLGSDRLNSMTLDTPRALQPLPLLGIPGWDEANDVASYYDNASVFRPGRRSPV